MKNSFADQLALVAAAADAEDEPPAGEDVDGREVLGQPDQVQVSGDVEAATEGEPPRPLGRHKLNIGMFRDAAKPSRWKWCSASQRTS